MSDGPGRDRLYRRRQARRMPWQLAGILALMIGLALVSQALWLGAGIAVLIAGALLLISLTR